MEPDDSGTAETVSTGHERIEKGSVSGGAKQSIGDDVGVTVVNPTEVRSTFGSEEDKMFVHLCNS